MSEIQNVETLENYKLNYIKRRTKKNKIFLYDTKRRYNHFISMLKYRNNGNYDDIPHFIITKNGSIYNIFNPNYYSKTFYYPEIDKKLIKIALENLGWLKKNTITGVLNNWINDPYRGSSYIKKWRNYFFWDSYTESQLNSLKFLTKKLSNEFNIPYETISNSGYYKNVLKFNGIVSKSNFDTIYRDINPSFDYKIFNDEKENIE